MMQSAPQPEERRLEARLPAKQRKRGGPSLNPPGGDLGRRPREGRMTVSTRRWSVALVVVAILSVGAIYVVGQATTQDMAAKVWAQGLTAEDRAAAGRQFFALPAAFRKALLQAQTGSEKSVMARRLISGFVVANSELTPEQRAVLEEAYGMLTPEFCSTVHENDPTGLGRRIMALLPKEDMSASHSRSS